jgi:GNAT superfamily N-acetyltransferase
VEGGRNPQPAGGGSRDAPLLKAPALPEGVSIRPAVAEDVPLILQLIRELAQYERLAGDVVATEELLRRHLFGTPPAAEVMLAVCNGDPAGFVLYFRNFSTFVGRPGIYVEDLYVRERWRGRGLGRAMLRRVAGIARDCGCGRMEWTVLDWNEPAIGFYRSIGARSLDDWRLFRLTGDALRDFAD